MKSQPNGFPQGKPHIASVAVASPSYTMDQAQAKEFLMEHYPLSRKNLAVMHKIFAHRSILRRHFAFEDPKCLINEDPDKRIARFTHWAVELSSQAIVNALGQVGLTGDDVSGLVVNTCTGYICPGVSTYLMEKLGFSKGIRAYDLVGSGCGGALPNLQLSEAVLKGVGDGVIVSVSVEICSATFQMEDDMNLIISNAIFADGAAASVIRRIPQGLELIASSNHHVPEQRDSIRYIYKNGQLYNRLSPDLPELVGRMAGEVVLELLKPRSLKTEDIKYWALHPGGEKVINAVKDKIGLSETQLRATREVLANYGNMSSPTVWFVLREILNMGIAPGEWCVMVAFGAGFSAYAYLLKG
jgi:predicted naringenin-chalcone synthase